MIARAPVERPLHPGAHLRDYLESQELSQSDFAERAGVSEKHVSQILSGKAGISAEMALAIERVLGGGAGMWVNIDSAYRLRKAREWHRSREGEHVEWAREFPLTELRKRGYLHDGRLSADTVAELLSFFGVADIEQWEQVYSPVAAQFRQSPSYTASWKAQASYLRICELQAEVWDLAPFDRNRVEEIVRKVRDNLASEPVGLLQRAGEELAEAGVALVMEPGLPKARLSGAAFWPRRNKAVLALTMRFKTADHLLFSFFHEAAHLLLHRDRTLLETEVAAGQLEDEADRFARRLLISDDAYRKLVNAGAPSLEEVEETARQQGLAVDSLIGMLQHDGVVRYTSYNGYKRPVSTSAAPVHFGG